MGAAFFVTLERPMDEIDPLATSGKALAQYSDELDALATELGVTPLSQFVSMSAEEVEQMLDLGGIGADELNGLPDDLQETLAEGMDEINSALGALKTQITEHGVPPEDWFEPLQGLQTVQRLLADLRTKPDRIAKTEDVVRDLEEIEVILKAAEQDGVRFHLSVEI